MTGLLPEFLNPIHRLPRFSALGIAARGLDPGGASLIDGEKNTDTTKASGNMKVNQIGVEQPVMTTVHEGGHH